MGKKGLGHIEAILSFILFIGFIFFGLYFFSPATNSKLVDSSLTYAELEVAKNVYVDMEVYTVVINQTALSKEAEKDRKAVSVNLGKSIPSTMNVIVKSYSGGIILAKKEMKSGEYHVNLLAGRENITFVYLVEDLPASSNDPRLIGRFEEGYYQISSSESRKVVSERRAKSLANVYTSDYEVLKKQFNFPSRADFGFVITLSPLKNITAENKIPSTTDVFSNVKRVEVLEEDGTLKFGDLIIKVW
jgi:hypothetical protein